MIARALPLALVLGLSQPAWACANAMKEHETDLVWLVLPAVFLVAMLGATIFLVLRTHGGQKEGN